MELTVWLSKNLLILTKTTTLVRPGRLYLTSGKPYHVYTAHEGKPDRKEQPILYYDLTFGGTKFTERFKQLVKPLTDEEFFKISEKINLFQKEESK